MKTTTFTGSRAAQSDIWRRTDSLGMNGDACVQVPRLSLYGISRIGSIGEVPKHSFRWLKNMQIPISERFSDFMVKGWFLKDSQENQFVMVGRHTREHAGRKWTQSNHELDFIFQRDGAAYGLEVKNTLGYMDQDEFALKTRLCTWLDIRPVFVCRMLPKSWIYQLNQAKGFALILKYQLYPWTHHELAKRVARELGLPVDAPRSLAEPTMSRFLKWHLKQL